MEFSVFGQTIVPFGAYMSPLPKQKIYPQIVDSFLIVCYNLICNRVLCVRNRTHGNAE